MTKIESVKGFVPDASTRNVESGKSPEPALDNTSFPFEEGQLEDPIVEASYLQLSGRV